MKGCVAGLLVAGLAFFGLSACSGDGDKDSKTSFDTIQEQVGTEDAAGEVGPIDFDTATPPGECAGLPDLTGRAYRVTKLKASLPTSAVDPVWAEDIAKHTLVLIFYIVKHDVEGKSLTIQVTSALSELEGGEPTGYWYALTPSEFVAPLNGCKFKVEDIELDIQTPTVSKPFHVFNLNGAGIISEDGNKIVEVYLKGGINEESTKDLCLLTPLGYVSFRWFMNLAGICASWDSDEDGQIDAYYFEGRLAATLTDLFHPGELKPIQPELEGCVPNSDECTPSE